MNLSEQLLNLHKDTKTPTPKASFSIDESGNMNEGYTQYYSFMTVHKPSYKNALADIKKMVMASKILADGAGEEGTKPETKKGITFNGIGDDSYETFSLPATPKKGYSDFCKTNRKPYDKYVSACMLILKAHLGDSIQASSDGDFENGKTLFKKFNTAEGNPVVPLTKKTKAELALEDLEKMGNPNFNDQTVKMYIGSFSKSGYRPSATLSISFAITKERNDLIKTAKLDHTCMTPALEDYISKVFGFVPYGYTVFKQEGKATKGLARYRMTIEIEDGKLAYGLGANMSYENGNDTSTKPAEVKKKMKMYDDMIVKLDQYKSSANKEIDLRTTDKDEQSKIWKEEYMKGYVKLSDKFKKRGFIHPRIMGA